ncbi:MAG: hypothetical protein A3H52_02220 [Candidatus Zambryskibacteria bacterium RIFCSPLOWO2_02_FULL_39_26]|uniref:SET domain-containing protein n=1 Tax=Candidatus Zambryskibacteria bacterium RIFCSPLOWO2_12_FULL_39_23 TaxID=1802776 RepID=A0A1G2URJ0_9BACT|nr:MAG: hypothetical protein A2W51_01045 [Candidatus Zambryskibacteria bacterium RIFCSPHIGHO2_02_39_10]OHA98821.1 MAG: hypothetical protein A3E59_00670 [Candidatus Zambryskibacteria bacterium RIFCSPHIGHO2_12_FULL_39_47]OHB09405.1 MAG: hypothetical protein A3H52_02220 [Candidatus Zambryskibacteria bacterium RIFCSPLOWO2_02_FULL_39_26]OHB11979.1 MAG: hypothetical protein A3G99_02755 [Candidatus Zambryskibacteria bacterium RIFCSPLOWO2_12_FULL_39_23]
MASYISPKVKNRFSQTSGRGLSAVEEISKGEIVADYTNGTGEYIDTEKSDELFEKGNDHMIQIDDDLFFAAVKNSDSEDADYINHSCDSNCGIKDKLKIVARKDIDVGEEITIDYAMMESSDYSFKCNCGFLKCRGVVTGNDWKIPELQNRYSGYFSGYLQEKIDKFH